MNATEVTRLPVSELPVQRFLAEYVENNRPVIVTGALEEWDIAGAWTPAALEKRFGKQLVQVYNNYFDLQTLTPLKRYLSENFGKDGLAATGQLPYVRWYTKLRDSDFYWADDVFSELQSQWRLPTFLPNSSYLLPFAPAGTTISPVADHFPARGLFISPRGARTSLHVDPWGSCAALCQLYGSKRWYFYAPGQRKYLESDFGVVDVTRPDSAKFPAFSLSQLTATCTLRAGEVIYVPHGWYHQVECDSDSISLTWNFVHETTVSTYLGWLTESEISEFDQSVLRFFYGIPAGGDVVEQVLTRLRGRSISSWLVA